MTDYTSRDGNNFNLIRMIAAYLVILSHATALQGRGTDIVVRLTGQTHSGQMAVFIFTFLSGIFITKSVMNSSALEFIKKRVLRLYPELILCLIFVLFLGSFFTTLSQFEYWTDPQTRKYFVANLLEVANEHVLPGVFENHPMAGMNGVLWYITFEIRIYLLWALLKSFKVFDDKKVCNVVLLVLLSWVMAAPKTVPFLGSDFALYGNDGFPQYTITFIIAALVYVNVENVRIKWVHVLVVIWLMYIFRYSTIGTWIWAAGYIVIALWIGTNKKVVNLKVKDLSYGIFLYGWPTGQIVNEFLPNASALAAAIITALGATLLAFFSEKVVGIITRLCKRITTKEVLEEK